jgi:hypothetical protein
MIWNLSAFESAISDRDLHLTSAVACLSSLFAVLFNSFYRSHFQALKMISRIRLVFLDRVITGSRELAFPEVPFFTDCDPRPVKI